MRILPDAPRLHPRAGSSLPDASSTFQDLLEFLRQFANQDGLDMPTSLAGQLGSTHPCCHHATAQSPVTAWSIQFVQVTASYRPASSWQIPLPTASPQPTLPAPSTPTPQTVPVSSGTSSGTTTTGKPSGSSTSTPASGSPAPTTPAQPPTGQTTTVQTTTVQVTQTTSWPGGRPADPLLVDLDGTGPRTTGVASGRIFDLKGDGHARTTSFAAGSSAFLALDRNGNGQIDSGQELFGDQHGAQDGFEELRRFDSDHNGRIDDKDPVFKDLRLLRADGTLETLAQDGIAAFDLDAALAARQTTDAGDPIYRQAHAITTTGRSLDTYALGLWQA